MKTEEIQLPQGEIYLYEDAMPEQMPLVASDGRAIAFIPIHHPLAKEIGDNFVTCWNEYDKLKKDNAAMMEALKGIVAYADSVNSASDLYNSPLVEDVKAVIKEVEQK